METGYLELPASWPNGSHLVYSLACLLVLALLFFNAASPFLTGEKRLESGLLRFLTRRSVFYVLLALLLFLGRSPSFLAMELNPDESIFLAGAITLQEEPVFWRDVDTTTSGVLLYLAPLLLPLLGLPLGYGPYRFLAVILLMGIFLFCGGTVRRLFSGKIERVTLAPFACYYALMPYRLLLAHNTEFIPLLLLAGAIYLLVRSLCRDDRISWGSLVGAGLLLGLVPHSKAQAVLAGLYVAAAGGGLLLWRLRQANWKNRAAYAGAFIIAGLFPTLVVLIYVQIYQTWETFIWNTVTINAMYSEVTWIRFEDMGVEKSRFWMAGHVFEFLGQMPFLREFLGLLVLTCFSAFGYSLSSAYRRKLLGKGQWLFVALAALGLGVMFFTVIFPGRAYLHYMEFLILPLVYLLAGALAVMFGRGPATSEPPMPDLAGPKNRQALVLLWVFLGLMLAPASVALSRPHTFLPLTTGEEPAPERRNPVLHLMRALSQPGDRLVVYGFAPKFHVLTGIPQGYPTTVLEYAISPVLGKTWDRDRFQRQMPADPPEFFMEIVDKTTPPEEEGEAEFLQQFLADNYVQIIEIQNYRIYIHQSLHEQLEKTQIPAPPAPAQAE